MARPVGAEAVIDANDSKSGLFLLMHYSIQSAAEDEKYRVSRRGSQGKNINLDAPFN